jgi:hypothetical protein
MPDDRQVQRGAALASRDAPLEQEAVEDYLSSKT